MLRPSPVLLLLSVAVGCAHNISPAFPPSREPKIIAIRNATNRPVASIALQEDHDAAEAPRRVGAISPVVPNHTYAFRRLPDAPSLPQRLRVVYRYPDGPEQSTVIDLREPARQAKGDQTEALVIELRPDGAVAYIDHLQP